MSLILDCQLPERVEFHILEEYDSEEAKLADAKDALERFPNFYDPEVESVESLGSVTTLRTQSGVTVTTDPSRPWVAEVDF